MLNSSAKFRVAIRYASAWSIAAICSRLGFIKNSESFEAVHTRSGLVTTVI